MRHGVVVTGAGGFVGGYVARSLAERGAVVTAITRGPGGRDQANLSWRRADLMEPGALPEEFDALIHCAAELPSRCPDPIELYQRNLIAARNVFERSCSVGARSVILLSSMSVYGTIAVPVVTESTPRLQPDAYGRAKWDAEQLLEGDVARGLPSGLAIRLPGTVGRGSHHNFLSDAIARVLRGEAVYANNPEAPFNNIVFVGDLATFLASWIADPRPGYHVTNLGAREPLTIREILSLLFACTGRPERIEFSEGGKASFLISLDRALSLGYSPATVRTSVEAFVHDSIAP